MKRISSHNVNNSHRSPHQRLHPMLQCTAWRRRANARQRNAGRHELIYRGQLLGEHLFLGPDYQIRDGDIVHFAARKDEQKRTSSGGAGGGDG